MIAYMSIGQAATFQYDWQPEWSMTGRARTGRTHRTPPGRAMCGFITGTRIGRTSSLPETTPTWTGLSTRGLTAQCSTGLTRLRFMRNRVAKTAYAEMINLVMLIADYAHERSPDFGVFTINGEDIPFREPESAYMEHVTGAPVEDLYYGYPRDQDASPPEWTRCGRRILPDG